MWLHTVEYAKYTVCIGGATSKVEIRLINLDKFYFGPLKYRCTSVLVLNFNTIHFTLIQSFTELSKIISVLDNWCLKWYKILH